MHLGTIASVRCFCVLLGRVLMDRPPVFSARLPASLVCSILALNAANLVLCLPHSGKTNGRHGSVERAGEGIFGFVLCFSVIDIGFVCRTAWVVYTLDTLASLGSGTVQQVVTRDIRHIPLPYASSIWTAPTPEEWCRLMMLHEAAGITLDDAMYCLCHLLDPGESRLFSTVLGPYARHIVVLTMLRGLIEYGQGKPKGGYITCRWVASRPADPKPQSPEEIHNHIINSYSTMLYVVRTPLFLLCARFSRIVSMHLISGAEVGISI